jgi:hypothetical protein
VYTRDQLTRLSRRQDYSDDDEEFPDSFCDYDDESTAMSRADSSLENLGAQDELPTPAFREALIQGWTGPPTAPCIGTTCVATEGSLGSMPCNSYASFRAGEQFWLRIGPGYHLNGKKVPVQLTLECCCCCEACCGVCLECSASVY